MYTYTICTYQFILHSVCINTHNIYTPRYTLTCSMGFGAEASDMVPVFIHEMCRLCSDSSAVYFVSCILNYVFWICTHHFHGSRGGGKWHGISHVQDVTWLTLPQLFHQHLFVCVRERVRARCKERLRKITQKRRYDGVRKGGRKEERPVSVTGANELRAE